MPSMCVGVDVLLESLEEKFCSNYTDHAEQQLPFRFFFLWVYCEILYLVITVTYLYQKCHCG